MTTTIPVAGGAFAPYEVVVGRGLLKAGIELYEYQGESRLRLRQGIVGSRIRRGTAPFARNKLHAKIFSVDRTRVFIGTFNFDPRSLFLNTEMGVVIESVPLATAMQTSLEETVPQYAYAVTLDKQQRLQWQDPESGSLSRKEPQAGFWKRVAAKLLSFLPIEGLL